MPYLSYAKDYRGVADVFLRAADREPAAEGGLTGAREMTDTLQWAVRGTSFTDGSQLRDWRKIYDSETWHWQYDTHELSFSIYEHDGQYWKLYRVRFVPEGESAHAYDFGGQACRMALVRYRRRAKSPHSSLLMEAGDEEWVRTYEVDEGLHEVLQAGKADAKYGAPYGPKRKAA